jgi:hypothetical protein
MKKLIISSFIFMIITGASFAQSRTNLMGPKAKNYKPWENKNTEVSPTSHLAEPSKKEFGGKAKNQKRVLHTEKVIVIQNGSKKSQLMGPKAKNYKAWED